MNGSLNGSSELRRLILDLCSCEPGLATRLANALYGEIWGRQGFVSVDNVRAFLSDTPEWRRRLWVIPNLGRKTRNVADDFREALLAQRRVLDLPRMPLNQMIGG